MNTRIQLIRHVILLLLSLLVSSHSFAENKRKAKEADPKNKYEELFENKKHESVSSDFMTLHKVDGKLYVELPLHLLGKDMLLASTVAETSEPMAGVPGHTPNSIYFCFTLQDGVIHMRLLEDFVTTDSKNTRMMELFTKNFDKPIWMGFDVLAYNPDSSAVVFDMTKVFQTDVPELYPLVKTSGIYDIAGKFNTRTSHLDEIKAFERNITVTSTLSYDVDATYWFIVLFTKKNVEIKVTRSLVLLPDEIMPCRIADDRIGVSSTDKIQISEAKGTMRLYSIAHRWHLEPKDKESFCHQKGSEPLTPITIYVDQNFPENWKEPIRQGILAWNKAFEKIGFLNAIQVKDVPTNDPTFDPNNVAYSCVRYVMHTNTSPETSLRIDPRSGEILNATICLFHGMKEQAFIYRFLQTAAVDARIRQKDLSDKLWAECLKQYVSHEMGHVLGLEDNMCASFAYPVDSLRSASFTRQFGISSSIMDEIGYNYIAQANDKNVRWTATIGPYDEFAIQWLYSPLYEIDSIPEKEKVLSSWLDEKAGNPLYRYGWKPERYLYDPSRLSGDLGNNAIKAGNYALRNLKETISHLNEWLPDDIDGSIRKKVYKEAGLYFEELLNNAIKNVGGAYLFVPNEKTMTPSYQLVDKKMQKESLLWVLEQLRNSEWLADIELITLNNFTTPPNWRIFRRFASAPFMREDHVCWFENIDSTSYTLEEYAKDLYEGIWKNAIENKPLTVADRYMQRQWIESSEYRVRVMGGNGLSKSLVLHALSNEIQIDTKQNPLPMNSLLFAQQSMEPNISNIDNINDSHMYFFMEMKECIKMLEQRIHNCKKEDKAHYQAMLYCLKALLKEKN